MPQTFANVEAPRYWRYVEVFLEKLGDAGDALFALRRTLYLGTNSALRT